VAQDGLARQLGGRFGNWLNKQMGPDLPLGDIEAREWRDELLLHTAWGGALHRLRAQGDTPTYVPTRESVQ
jgi:CRISPR-associated protein Csy1